MVFLSREHMHMLIDGISFLKSLETPPKTIITSAHSDYALDGYDLNVVDYLMKPMPACPIR